MIRSFSRKEMIDVLESNGYEVKKEEHTYLVEYGNSTIPKTIEVNFVYKNGNKVDVSYYIVDQDCIVEEIFSRVLNNKILELLKK
jgi:hypothetical protein